MDRELAALRKVQWADCAEVDCIGVCLPPGEKCWAHAALEDREDGMKRLREDGLLDARGVPFTEELLQFLLSMAPQNDHKEAVLTDARFDGATFTEMAWFGATTFRGKAYFSGATFESHALFGGATFEDGASFLRAAFQGIATFDNATFGYTADFEVATFQNAASFDGATFQTSALFNRATFEGEVEFSQATVRYNAWFEEATFRRPRQIGPMLVRGTLNLDSAEFHQRARIEVSANAVCARNARFPAGVHLRAAWAQIVLEDADFPAPSLLEAIDSFADLDEASFVRIWVWLRRQIPIHLRQRPRVLSLCRADVSGLTLSGVDLTACRFHGAHNLDRIRLEGHAIGRPPRSRWRTRRCTLAEEHDWRHEVGRPGDWFPQPFRIPAWMSLEERECPVPSQIANLYRALRKSREDAKDEPGAADFYYGEMEMRRHAARRLSVERAILTLYWAFSGYGLRAWRAAIGWALLVLIGAAMFAGFGFKPPPSPEIVPVSVSLGRAVYEKRDVPRPSSLQQVPEALAFSAESTVSLLRPPDRSLTLPGRWTQMALRVLGPVLFGLIVLSLRGRVKR